MTVAAAHSDPGAPPSVCERSLKSCIELVFAPPRPGMLAHPWNAAPGAVLRSALQTDALHVAPGRWLLLDADAQAVTDAVGAGAVAIDVDSKWRCFEIRGAGAGSALSAGVNVAMILEGRECAAVPLFDCPTVIAVPRLGDGFDICVHASYTASLRVALQAALRRSAGS